MIARSTDTNPLAGDTDLTIRPLRIEDAGTVSAMLLAQPAQYARFFYAFGFSEDQITHILAKRINDVYSGMFWRGELVGIFMLRKKMPHAERPYKIWLHPFVTLLFIIFTAFFLVITVYNDVTNYINHRQPVVNSLLGILITALGVPLYFYFRKKKN